jgi:DNA-binding NarL/FixJ family response regulator
VSVVRALVVDSDPHTTAQVRAALLRDGVDTAVAASAGTAMALARGNPPDLLVADLDVGGPEGGIDLAAAIRRRWRTSVVLLARQVQPSSIRAIVAIDAAGVVCKPFDARQLETTLRFALQRHASGERPAAETFTGGGDPAMRERLALLRPRQREVVCLLLEHNRVATIARQLGISPQTTRNHLKDAFKRTGTHSQEALLRWLRDGGDPAAGTVNL